jgi:anti-anti-sigma factor
VVGADRSGRDPRPRRVEFFGSPALRAVLDALGEAARHGSEMTIVRMSEACRRVFTITGFGYLVPQGIGA